jgi:dTDP-4-dehydrorhamnose reductase
VAPITTADYPTPARRPANSRLSTARIEHDFGIVPRPWRTAIDGIVDQLLAKERKGA